MGCECLYISGVNFNDLYAVLNATALQLVLPLYEKLYVVFPVGNGCIVREGTSVVSNRFGVLFGCTFLQLENFPSRENSGSLLYELLRWDIEKNL